jgi:O-glycosyl hydrolase
MPLLQVKEHRSAVRGVLVRRLRLRRSLPEAKLRLHGAQTALATANLNAGHYWWLWAGGSSGLYDTNTTVWTKRFWIMGNFSRFVRPGYLRVTTSATPISLFVSGAAPCTVTPRVTSATDRIAAKTPITITNARFSASLRPQAVTTFVGKPRAAFPGMSARFAAPKSS